jgi:hypothetical protein
VRSDSHGLGAGGSLMLTFVHALAVSVMAVAGMVMFGGGRAARLHAHVLSRPLSSVRSGTVMVRFFSYFTATHISSYTQAKS